LVEFHIDALVVHYAAGSRLRKKARFTEEQDSRPASGASMVRFEHESISWRTQHRSVGMAVGLFLLKNAAIPRD